MVNICLAKLSGTLQRGGNILRGVTVYINHVFSVAKL